MGGGIYIIRGIGFMQQKAACENFDEGYGYFQFRVTGAFPTATSGMARPFFDSMFLLAARLCKLLRRSRLTTHRRNSRRVGLYMSGKSNHEICKIQE